MVQDQDQPKYGNTSNTSGGGGGGKVLKKQKQRKIPQRGLGVAQLEKIRLEELHKNEGGGPPPPPPAHLLFPLPQQHHDLGSLTAALRSNLLPATGGYSKFSFGGGGVGSSSSSSSMQEHYSSKMNVARSISSGLNLQIEPPSNQSYNSNYNYRHPLLLQDDKVGMKRTYPFSLDQPLHCKIPGLENAATFNLEPGISNLREGSSHQFDRRPTLLGSHLKNGYKDRFDSRPGFPEFNLRNGNKENEPLDTALTLGLPTSSFPTMTNKAKHPLEFPASSSWWYQECSNINASSQQQEIFMGDPLFRRGESIQSQRVYDFFPPKPQQNGHLAASSSGERSGISDPLDLDLKL